MACRLAGMTVAEALSTGRTQSLAYRRFHVMAILRQWGMSLPQIGRMLGRDHTSVWHGIVRWHDMAARDAFRRCLSLEAACAQVGVRVEDARRFQPHGDLLLARRRVIVLLRADGWTAAEIATMLWLNQRSSVLVELRRARDEASRGAPPSMARAEAVALQASRPTTTPAARSFTGERSTGAFAAITPSGMGRYEGGGQVQP